MKINEVAKKTGISIRTLHYYDEIGLLKPDTVSANGYRSYDKASLEILHQILFFRELDFPLAQIKEIMSNPGYDKMEAMQKHKELLLKKRERMDQLIQLIEQSQKGEIRMNFDAFDESDIQEMKATYAKEVKERWGNTDAYLESKQKTKGYDKKKWEEVNKASDLILEKFAQLKEQPIESFEVQALVFEWKAFITKYFYNCTDEILSGLGQMYVMDERFTKNMDKFAIGTTAFISKAIAWYCEHAK